MKKIGWTATLETGIAAVDFGNQKMLAMIDRVIAASDGSDPGALKAALTDLQTETIAHFDREEQLMAECKYQAASQHRAEHQQLLAEIQHQINDMAVDKANISHIGRFMHNWLLQHITSKDQLLGNAILTQHGTTDRRDHPVAIDLADEPFDLIEERRLGDLEEAVWTSKLAVGNEEIDAGHRSLFAALNAILVTRKSADQESLATLLEDLGNATAAHFACEEKLMANLLDDKALARHLEEHKKLLDEFGNLVDDWRDKQISSDLLCRFLYRWLLGHIAGSDLPLGEAIKRRAAGVSP